MPYRHADAEYLRDKARAFRAIARRFDGPGSKDILAIANELEAKAEEIERRQDPRQPK